MKQMYIVIVLILLFNSCKETNEQLIDRAIAYKQEGKFMEAIAIYSNIINKNTKLQVPYYNRGLCYAAIKDFPKALADFNKIMALQGGPIRLTYNPDSPFADEEARAQIPYNDALYQRAQVLYEMDSIQSSYRDFKQLIAENYHKSNCLLWHGVLWLKNGDKGKACESFLQARQYALGEEDKKEAEKFINNHCNK